MLHEFISAHRHELISRCQDKAAKRHQPIGIAPVAKYGIPVFLQQLVDALRLDSASAVSATAPEVPVVPDEIGPVAALHGAEMLRLGYTIEQVVREYGDVCQSVTELSTEQKETITTEEFRTLNRCLDDAIADAVTAYSGGRQIVINSRADFLSTRLGSFHDEQQRLVDSAIHAFSAIQTGSVATNGSTGAVLVDSLLELRALTAWAMSDIRLMSAMTTMGAI